MSTLDDLNPFVVLRARARNENGRPLTQSELAVYANVSEQYIRRQETGLINQPSPKVNEALTRLYGEQELVRVLRDIRADIIIETELRPPELELITIDSTYRHWQLAKRHALASKMEWREFSECRNLAQLVDRVCLALGLMPTVYAFAKELAIHPYAVQSALDENHVSGHLEEALRECGIKWGSNVYS